MYKSKPLTNLQNPITVMMVITGDALGQEYKKRVINMRNHTRKLTETALMLAVATVLSMIQFPGPWAQGGAVTLCSMLPICIISFRYGVKWGLVTGCTYGILQLFLGMSVLRGVSLSTVLFSILLDYLLAFGVLGLTGIFRRTIKDPSGAFVCGSTMAITLRFACHFISGIFVWDTILDKTGINWAGIVYSLAYNGSYMLPELIITVAAGAVFCRIFDFLKPNPIRK